MIKHFTYSCRKQSHVIDNSEEAYHLLSLFSELQVVALFAVGTLICLLAHHHSFIHCDRMSIREFLTQGWMKSRGKGRDSPITPDRQSAETTAPAVSIEDLQREKFCYSCCK